MSKYRDELVAIRKSLFERLEKMRKVGDYSAGAADIRENAETQLKVIDLMLERTK
jgi:hypothetical protein